jgi:hypothetical protein
LWIPESTRTAIRKGLGVRLQTLLPHFQRALQTTLFEHQGQFPALFSQLTGFGSIPLIFDLGDYRSCQDPNISTTNDTTSSSTVVEPRMVPSLNVPLFTIPFLTRCNFVFPIPGYSTYEYVARFGEENGTNVWRDRMANWSRTFPWDKKKSSVYWRGGCKKNRHEFLRKALRRPAYTMDVFPVGGCPVVKQRKKAKNIQRFVSSWEESMEYKAVFDIDGNSWSERFPRLLCYNSAVIRVELDDDFEEYMFKDLVPGVHFIPATLNNFTDVARLFLSGDKDDYLQSVVQNANDWCATYMTVEMLNL